MTTNELKVKMQQVADIDRFIEDLAEATNEEEVKAVLKEHGLDITLEDLAAMEMQFGELDETSLDMVAGGKAKKPSKCGCTGILGRIIKKALSWFCYLATGEFVVCEKCDEEIR